MANRTPPLNIILYVQIKLRKLPTEMYINKSASISGSRDDPQFVRMVIAVYVRSFCPQLRISVAVHYSERDWRQEKASYAATPQSWTSHRILGKQRRQHISRFVHMSIMTLKS
jgi:hypothetical protein